MIVSDLIRALKGCDPDAVVLIPRDVDLTDAAEWVSDVVSVPSERFSSGPAAAHGAVRLVGFPAATTVVVGSIVTRGG
jgi:hypothetical protein